MVIDLHCHSTASDGLLAPAAVVEVASLAGLAAIALTDHDTTAGLDEARTAGERLGVRVVGGCEFSVAAPWGEMHLLGYFIEPGDPVIERFLAEARDQRAERAGAMIDRLQGLGVRIGRDDVLRESAGGAIGRPHVARALHRLGHVASVQAAFDRYIGRGRPAYVEKALPAFATVTELVHGRGGVVSAAHLKGHGTRAALERMQGEGLDAVEVRHPGHDGDRVAILTDAALDLDLGRSGGSDWHGETLPEGNHASLGSQQVPIDWLDDLEARRPRVGT